MPDAGSSLHIKYFVFTLQGSVAVTRVRSLDFATPVSLLGTSEGTMRVTEVLGQMEHSLW